MFARTNRLSDFEFDELRREVLDAQTYLPMCDMLAKKPARGNGLLAFHICELLDKRGGEG